jgi:uncharacterized OsmC-like protein
VSTDWSSAMSDPVLPGLLSSDDPADIEGRRDSVTAIGDALKRMRRVFEAKPSAAVSEDQWACATLRRGVRLELLGPGDRRYGSDLPAAIGGDASGPPPGWYFRAGLAACIATATQIYAAERGILLDLLEVKVTSRSDQRSLLGVAGASGAMSLCTEVRIAAADVPDEDLLALVRRAQAESPVSATVAAGQLGVLRMAIVR